MLNNMLSGSFINSHSSFSVVAVINIRLNSMVSSPLARRSV